jgi:phage gp16-like protein
MPTDEEMTLDERLKYLRKMKKRYDKADHAERAPLLDEMEHVTELHRKSIMDP